MPETRPLQEKGLDGLKVDADSALAMCRLWVLIGRGTRMSGESR